MRKLLSGIRWFAANIDWLMAIALSIATFALGTLQQVPLSFVTTTTLLVLGMLSLSALRDRETSSDLRATVHSLESKSASILRGEDLLGDKSVTGISRVFPQAVDFDWLPLINAARNVTIVRVRMDFHNDPAYFAALERILVAGGSVTLILADPRAPAMWLRYQEEPNPFSSETAWSSGLENLANNAIALHTWIQRLASKGLNISKLQVKLFPHYPGEAFYRFDDAIYVYHYSFRERGIHAPVFLFNNPATTVHQYLRACLEHIVSSSAPVEELVEEIKGLVHAGRLSDRTVGRAQIVVQLDE